MYLTKENIIMSAKNENGSRGYWYMGIRIREIPFLDAG